MSDANCIAYRWYGSDVLPDHLALAPYDGNHRIQDEALHVGTT